MHMLPINNKKDHQVFDWHIFSPWIQREIELNSVQKLLLSLSEGNSKQKVAEHF